MFKKLTNDPGQFLRDIVFGFNDAILTNLGIVAGFSLSLHDSKLIILACLVDIFISAFAMSFGTYMSRTSEQDFLKTKLESDTHKEATDAMGNPIVASVVMWVTYVIAGFIPVWPYLVGYAGITALTIALIFGITAFFILGLIKGKLTQTSLIKSGLQFFAFGLVSAVIGLIVGKIGNQF